MLTNKAIAVTKCENICILRLIFLQPITYFKLDSNKRTKINNKYKVDFLTIKDYILNLHYDKFCYFVACIINNFSRKRKCKITCTMESIVAIS